MKLILKWTGIVVGGIVLLVAIAGIALMVIVDKEMIAGQMQKALNRQVTIGDIDVSIFSVLSGIEVKDVAVSNYKTPEQLKKLEGRPVAKDDLFAGMKSLNFKVRILPLVKGRLELRELVLKEPRISIVRYPSGAFNFSDLMVTKELTPEERRKLAEEARKEEAVPAKPFAADDLPVEIKIGRVGAEKGLITFYDQKLKQSIQIYNLTAMVYDIVIDPGKLASRNLAKLKLQLGIKSLGTITTGSVRNFDIGLSVNGTVRPFDVKTRLLNPEIAVKAGSSYGAVSGLQVYEKLKTVSALEKYTGKLGFLKDTIKWDDAFVNLWYKGGAAKLSNGRINAGDFLMLFEGSVNTYSKAILSDISMILANRHRDSIRTGIKDTARKAIKSAGVGKYLKPDKVADEAMKPLLNKDGKVELGYRVSGTTVKPDAKLVKPKLPSMKEIVKGAAKDLGDVMKKEAAKAVKKEAKKTTRKAEKKLKKKLKKLF